MTVLALVGLAGAASAQPAEDVDDVRLVRHEVEVALDDDQAVMQVQRSYRNAGRERAWLTTSIPLPVGLSLQGLRWRVGKGQWVEGRAIEADQADDAMDAPVNLAFAAGPVVLRRDGGEVTAQLVAIPPGGTITLGFTLVGPPCVTDAARWSYSVGGDEDPAQVRVRVRGGTARLAAEQSTTIDATSVEPPPQHDAACALGVGDGDWQFTRPRHDRTGLHSTAARVPGDASAAWFAMRIGPALAELPARPWVVVVLDVSRSLAPEAVRDQLALTAAMLRHVPDAQVQLVATDRSARDLLPGFTTARAIDVDALAGVITQGNGSNLDLGLARAAALLQGRPGPKRVLVLSDQGWRQSLDATALAAAALELPRDVPIHNLHVGAGFTVDEGPAVAGTAPFPLDVLEHQPESAMAMALAPWGGLSGELPAWPRDRLVEAARQLVVPIVLQQAVLATESGPVELGTLPAHASVSLALHEAPGQALHVAGWLWGRRWERDVPIEVPAGAAAARTAAHWLAVASHGPTAFEHAARHDAIGLRNGVLTEGVALVAAGRGVDPDEGGVGMSSICGCGPSSAGTIGHGAGTGTLVGQPRLTLRKLTAALTVRWLTRQCARATPLTVTWHVDGPEVVDVSASGGASAATACVRDALWAADLRGTTDLTGVWNVTLPANGQR